MSKAATMESDATQARLMQQEQTAREAAAAAAPATPAPQPAAVRAVAHTGAGPQGARVVKFFGVGNLRKNVQVDSIKAGVAIYCGRMTGIAYGVTRHPNSKDATKTSLCFTGRFINVACDGSVIESLGAYLPSSVEKAFAGMLESGATNQVQFALEVWAEPDAVTGRKSAQGYTYVAHDMTPRRQDSDPALTLAIAAGVIMPAQAERPAIGFDPDTGEVALDPA